MEIYVGSADQGKLRYVLEKKGCGMECVVDGADFLSGSDVEKLITERLQDTKKAKKEEAAGEGGTPPVIINHFQDFIANFSENPDSLYEYLDRLIQNGSDLVIICRQVGGGVVPVGRYERNLRELVGRGMCRLVSGAEHVERIVCGLGQVLKG